MGSVPEAAANFRAGLRPLEALAQCAKACCIEASVGNESQGSTCMLFAAASFHASACSSSAGEELVHLSAVAL